ncbi:MAG: PAS domain S-box protein [Gemmatimonadetes bacterium]|nr:PAS domain S-box protein [Gemmatimonadota bacterium]MBT7864609.1 PAS domain S-box protein [Gemmatimonadota bacterium]
MTIDLLGTQEQLLDAIPVPATLIDARGIIVDVNRAALDLARQIDPAVGRQHRVGCHIADFVKLPADRDRFRALIDDLLKATEPWQAHWESTRTDGESQHWRLQATVLREGNGRVVGALIMREDVTQQVRQENRQHVLASIRDQIWQMETGEEIHPTLSAVWEGLKQLGVPLMYCSINLLQEDATPDEQEAYSINPAGEWYRRPLASPAFDMLMQCWRDQELIHRPDLETADPFNERDHLRVPLRSIVDVPFSQGTLAVSSTQPEAFSPADLEVLQQIARVLSEGFGRQEDLRRLGRQNHDLQEKERLLAAYHLIGRLILKPLVLDEIMDTMVQQIVKVGIFRSLTFAIVDAEARLVLPRLTLSRRGDGEFIWDRYDNRYDLDDSPDIMAEVARSGRIEVIEGFDKRYTRGPQNTPDFARKTAYFFPVKLGEKTVAILATGSERHQKAATLRNIELMSPLLDLVAIALDHARMYDAVQKLNSEQAHQARLLDADAAVRLSIARMDRPGDLLDVVKQISKQLGSLDVEHDSCSIQVMNQQGDDFFSCGFEPPARRRGRQRLGDLVSLDWPAESANVEKYPWIVDVWRTGRPRYEPCTPATVDLVTGMSVLDVAFSQGTLAISHKKPGAFNEQHIELLERFSRILSEGFQRFVDILQATQASNLLRIRLRQQAAVANIGQYALTCSNISDLMTAFVARVADTMEVEFCKILELMPDGEQLLLRAGVGWRDGLVGHALVGTGIDSQAGFTLSTHEPVIVEDLRTETRFSGPELLQEHGIVSGMSAIIQGRGNPWGIVGVHTRQKRAFTTDDVSFLAAALNVLASAISQNIMGEHLRVSEAKYRHFIENAQEGVWLIDADSTTTFVNRHMAQMLGYGAEEMLGRHLFSFMDPAAVEQCKQQLSRRMQGFEDQHDFEFLHKDGSRVYATLGTSPIVDDKGTYDGAIAFVANITERVRLEEEMRKVQNLESLGLLAGGIAHDFNNVLTGITANLGMLEQKLADRSDEHDMVQDAIRAADRTRDLAQQLMTFAKGGAPVKETALIDELIQQTTQLCLRGSSTKPEFDFAADLRSIDMDIGQISQVVQNLILNADQAMPLGGILKIQAQNADLSDRDAVPVASGLYVKVSVEDQGSGMTEEIRRQVFDPYFTTKETGHGLGLSMSYSIISRHGGHIEVRSRPDVGTVVDFYLPASRQEAPTPDVGQQQPLAGGKGRILLMDDEEIVRQTVSRMLEFLGYVIDEVSNGDEAIRVYESAMGTPTAYDVVIMDLTIPGAMGGREAVTRLREIDPQVRAVVSSGYSNDLLMSNYADHGFCGRISKPVTIKELSSTLQQVLVQDV